MALRDFALLVLICLIWAGNNIISKVVVTDMGVPPIFDAALRFVVVAMAVFPGLLPMPRPAWRLIVVALLMGGGNFALLFIGLQTATASASAVVLLLNTPLTTVLGVFVLGERFGWRRGLGIALTFAGALVVMWHPEGFEASTGLLFVAAAAMAGAFGAVLMKQMHGVKPLQYQAWTGLISLPPLAALTVLLEPGQVSAGLAAGWPFVAAVVFSGLVVSVAAHSGFYILVQRYEANLVSALTLITPLATIGLGVALLGDRLDAQMIAGAAIALVGVLIVALRSRRAPAEVIAVNDGAR